MGHGEGHDFYRRAERCYSTCPSPDAIIKTALPTDDESFTEKTDDLATKLTLATKTEKHTPTYYLTATFSSPSSKTKASQTVKLSAPFTRWFTSEGHFVAKPFQQWLASSVPVIAEADPENVVEDIGRGSGNETAQSSGINLGGVPINQVQDILNQVRGGSAGQGKARKR